MFCNIAAKNEPSVVVHEDDDCLAFMDIYPLGKGHVLVVPKQHATRLEELGNSTQGHLFDIANKIIEAQRKAGFGQEGTNLLINDGKAANQTIPHVHIHLIPRKSGDLIQSIVRLAMHLSGFFGFRTDTQTLQKQARGIKKELYSGEEDD
ncbi:MAG: HIT family protein [Gammaproteobacteria bacterium]|nr:MAG: HIT family protein [Pseudomonadota bacterium]PIE38254.1 MAG: HIT family protein [Gammaproteobacteria bacterium]